MNWFDLFTKNDTVITEIQNNIQTVNVMTNENISIFMENAKTVVTDNLARTGLIKFIHDSDPDQFMIWRVNTTTDVEERLLSALNKLQTANLKIQCERDTPNHIHDIFCKNLVTFLIDTFIGSPCNMTPRIQSINTRIYTLSQKLFDLWLKYDPTANISYGSFTSLPEEITDPTIIKLREYTAQFINAGMVCNYIRNQLDDDISRNIKDYIDNKSNDLELMNMEYIDDRIYKYYTEYLFKLRGPLTKEISLIEENDRSLILSYFTGVETRDIYNVNPPVSNTLEVQLRKHSGVLEYVKMGDYLMVREPTKSYSYTNEHFGNRIARSFANLQCNWDQGNENISVLIAFAMTVFIDIPDVFTPRGFMYVNNQGGMDTIEGFTEKYKELLSQTTGLDTTHVHIVSLVSEMSEGPIEIPRREEDIIKFQYELFKQTNGYIYLFDRKTIESSLREYIHKLEDTNVRISADNIFEFGLQKNSTLAKFIVDILRFIDKTAITIESVTKLGVKIVSPVGLPVVYGLAMCNFILRELWWKLGYDDLALMYQVPPPFGLVVSVIHPIYSIASTMKHPVLLALQQIQILGIKISQFISKCIRDGLYVRLITDPNIRFLGVNFLMTPVYSSMGILNGTQMKRILDDASYIRMVLLQIMQTKYNNCEMEINSFLQTYNSNYNISELIRKEIKDKLSSPNIVDGIKANLTMERTNTYNMNLQRLNSPLKIQMNTIDLQFYDINSTSTIYSSVLSSMEKYIGENIDITENDVSDAILRIRQLYKDADTFQTHVYMSATQEVENNGYFIRGTEVTDNGMLEKIKSLLSESINSSVFFT